MRLQLLILFVSIYLLSCNKQPDNGQTENPGTTDTLATDITHPDHIIFVWFENKNFNSIIDSNNAPYIYSLAARGTLFTNMYAITHPSYPNYVSFFAGDQNNVTSDACIDSTTLTTPNLYTNLKEAGKSFAWYSEGLPETGSTECYSGRYYKKHNPTTIFANVSATANKPFSSFPTDYTQLENVVCISPDIINDMHSSSVKTGDRWLKKNMSALIDWCATHNSIFVIYFDEDDGTAGNQIPVIAVGQHVKVNYKETKKYDHYNWTRTVSEMFSAPRNWTSNLKSRSSIDSCWNK